MVSCRKNPGMWFCFLVVISCSVPQIGFAQIGQSKSDVLRLPKVIKTYSPEGQSDFESYRIAATDTDPIAKTYHVFRDRVGAISLEWQNKLTLDDALGQLNQVTGLPPLQLPPKKARWEIDRQQLDVFPPLGAWETQPVQVPIFSGIAGQRAQWTEYYNHWGKYLGSSPVRIVPEITTYTRLAGYFKFTAMKRAVPLVRVDSAAYAWLELASNSKEGQSGTNRIFIAEPEVYWRSRFEECRLDSKRLDDATNMARIQSKSLSNLRPYHLLSASSYRQTLFDNVPAETASVILAAWKLNAAIGAIDDVRVPVAAAQELALRCPDGDVCRSLLNGIKLHPVEVTIRRAEMLEAYGSLRWVLPLADLLRNKDKQAQLLSTMRTLAEKHGATADELKNLGNSREKWRGWYRKMTSK